MRIDWEMFMFTLIATIACALFAVGFATAMAMENAVWLLLWIPAAVLAILLFSTY